MEHDYVTDSETGRCKICGADELTSVLRGEGYIVEDFLPGETLKDFMIRTAKDVRNERRSEK
jgi:hypothetical protein